MRILHVDKFLRRQGGAAGYMLDLAALQRSAGHQVELFAMAHPSNQPATFDNLFPPFLPLDPPLPGAANRVATAAHLVWSSRAARAMAQVLDAFRPDVVHLHNIYHQLSPSILRPIARRAIPAVMTVHDYKLVCPSYRLLDGDGPCTACIGGGRRGRFWEAPRRRCKDGSLAASGVLAVETALHRWSGAYGPVGRFLAPSAFLADLLKQGGVYPDRVRHVPNFVDAAAVSPRRDAGDGFVSIGRLSAEKGVDVAIRAIGLLPGATLTVAGEGPERGRLERLAADVAPGQVRFVGHVGRAEVAALNQGARAAILAARWHENMPLSVLETLAASVPMVVTGLGGLPELIDHGGDGLVVEADDVDSLAAALDKLQSDPDLSVALGRAGRAKVTARYAAGPHLAHIETLYREAARA